MYTAGRRASMVACLAIASLASVRSTKGDNDSLPSSLRNLPALSVVWQAPLAVRGMAVTDQTAYVVSDGQVTAFRLATGERLWQTPVECTGNEWLAGPYVADSAIGAACGTRLLVLDAKDGHRRHELHLGGRILEWAAPPLLLTVSREGGTDLLRMDLATGRTLARRTLPGTVYQLMAVGGTYLVEFSVGKQTRKNAVAGLDSRSLKELWRRGDLAELDLRSLDGEPYLAFHDGCKECEETWARLEARDGSLGPRLPKRAESGCIFFMGMPWDIQLADDAEADPPRTRLWRNSRETGETLWTTTVPSSPRTWARKGDLLVLHSAPDAGRGVLQALDWSSGRLVRQWYGLSGVSEIQLVGTLAVLRHAGGVAVVRIDSGEPPEAQTRGIRDEVLRIVAAPVDKDATDVRDREAELRALGSSAAATLRDLVPTLDPVPLTAAAEALAEFGDREASAALAARLATLPVDLDEKLAGGWASGPREAILRALARLGSESEVPLLAGTMTDSNVPWDQRRLACLALVGIGAPEALRTVDAWLDAHAVAPTSPWWHPPSPEAFLSMVGQTVPKKAYDAAFERSDWQLVRKMEAARSSALVTDDKGSRFVVFQSAYVGGPANVWIAPLDRRGAPAGPAVFSGLSMHSAGRLVHEEVGIRATVSGGQLSVTRGGPGAQSVPLAGLDVDSDSDGLPDVVERWIGTDPERADTDGDGLPDGIDPAPNAHPPVPLTEEDAITAAIFEGFFLFEQYGADELAIVVTDRALEWRGRRGATLSLDAKADAAFLARAGYDGIAHISIDPYEARGVESPAPVVGSDERAYSLTLYRGGLNAVGYRAVVKKSGARWRLSDLRIEWVS